MILIPDKIFDSINDISAQLLEKEGIKGLVLDIDYTLAPKSEPLPDDVVIEFIKNLKSAGIELYIISNNHKNRVSKFASAIDLKFICNGMKPFPRSFRKAAREMGLKAQEVAAVGDQIYTDIIGAHSAGMRAWLVTPNGVNKSLFNKLRRCFELPFVKSFYKRERRRMK